MISNIKLSFSAKASTSWKRRIIENAEIFNYTCQEKGNIFIVRGIFSFCIFERKSRKKDNQNSERSLHINASGVKRTFDIQYALNYIQYVLLGEEAKIVSGKIDNMTATYRLANSINLRHLIAVSETFSGNFERFPAVYIKCKEGTGVIFSSGKINILGCKSKLSIEQAWEEIKKKINHACMQQVVKTVME